MSEIKIENLNEYHSLYGGSHERKKIGNAFQALINHCFGDSLIFSIIETVNLNNPSIQGLGDTLFFTHTDEDEENDRIKDEYKAIVNSVKKKFKHSLAEYSDWYEQDTFLAICQNDNPTVLSSENSSWRTKFFANREKREHKNKYGFLSYTDDKKSFKEFTEEYLKFYISLLQGRLSFHQFPHFAVIVRPICAKDKNGTIRLGNLYLHFATTDSKPLSFYERMLNDFSLIWIKEEGGIIINQITTEAIEKYKIKVDESNKSYLPTIWSVKDSVKFDEDLIKKIENDFGKSGKHLSDFFDEVFAVYDSQYLRLLKRIEEDIIEQLIPILLKNKGWLKDGVVEGDIKSALKAIRRNVEERQFVNFEPSSINLFVSLLALRHIVNLCLCCFNFSTKAVHSILTANLIDETSLNDSSYTNRLTGYFTKMFFYSPKDTRKNILTFDKTDAYYSASIKEKEFLLRCVGKINWLIKEQSKLDFNKNSLAQLQLNSTEIRRSYNDTVSKLAVSDFKHICDENTIIPKLLKEKASKYLEGPILDCGAGLGDIAFNAFPDKEAILIDVNPIKDKLHPTSELHTTQTISFFDYYPIKPIKTLLISHTLQFIDSDIDRLNVQIKRLDPKTIILVLNENDDFMGELLKWTKEKYDNANPEEKIPNFPNGYRKVHSIPFKANIKCDSFERLAIQISYLMMIDLSETGNQLAEFLKHRLKKKPEFSFNQVIEVYQK